MTSYPPVPAIPENRLIWPWELQCPSTKEIDIICIIINCITLTIVLFVGSISVKNQIINPKINTSLKILFYISFASAMIQLISSIIILSLCSEASQDLMSFAIPLILFEFGYYILVLCVLGTLLARLYTTFENSMFKISKSSRIILIIIYTLLLLACIGLIILFIITLASFKNKNISKVKEFRDVYMCLVLFIWILYILCALWAVYTFCKKILSLATLRRGSQQNLNVTLNAFQQKMIDLSSKYVALFVIALLSSLIVMVCWGYQGLAILSVPIISTVAGVDAAINIICLFLQYSFAKKYYNKCCGFIDLCCKKPLTKYIKKRISQSIKNNEQELFVNNV